MASSWFNSHRRQLHLDLHLPEFPQNVLTRLDPARLIEQIASAGINLVTLFAKDHFGNAYYATRVGHRHRALSIDFLQGAVEHARARGIRTLAYYSMCWDQRAWQANPDWRFEEADGTKPGEAEPWGGFLCPNSPYTDELALPQFAEIIRHYPVDGLFIDTPYAGGTKKLCHCRHCRERWKREFSPDMSKGVSIAMHHRLAMRACEGWLTELRDLVDRTNDQLLICMNNGSTPSSNRCIKELLDIGVWESQPHAGNYLSHSLACRFSRNDILDTQIMTVRFHHGWGDLTLKPAPQLMTEFAAMIGNGMVTNVGDQVQVDGSLQVAAYDTLREAFSFVERHEPVLMEAQSVRHAVILYPVLDEQGAFAHGLLRSGANSLDAVGYRGAHKMLTESHVQNDIAYSTVVADDLERYPMLVLPESAAYQPGLHDKLRDYVDRGGTLVAVGNALISDGRFALEDMFGIRYVGPVSFETVHFKPAAALAQSTAAIPLQVRGPSWKVLPTTAQELAALYWPVANHQPPGRAFRSPYPPAEDQRSPFPFATVHTFGKGKAVYIAASIFAIYWRTNHHWLRQFTDALLRHVDASMPYATDAPATVELNLMRRGEDFLLNLINYALGHQGGPEAIACIDRANPTHNITCHVRCAQPREVSLEPDRVTLPFTYHDGCCTFTVPKVEYLTVVRMAGGAANGSRTS